MQRLDVERERANLLDEHLERLGDADRVKIACLAQLVNVIAPIMTVPGGGEAWLQTIYYPFLHATQYGHGTVLYTPAKSPKYDSKNFTDVPYLESVAVYNEEAGEVTVFAVNRSTEESLELEVQLNAFSSCELIEHIAMSHEDHTIVNGPSAARVQPRKVSGAQVQDKTLTAQLSPISWNVLRLKVK